MIVAFPPSAVITFWLDKTCIDQRASRRPPPLPVNVMAQLSQLDKVCINQEASMMETPNCHKRLGAPRMWAAYGASERPLR